MKKPVLVFILILVFKLTTYSQNDTLHFISDTILLEEAVVLSSYRAGMNTPVTFKNLDAKTIALRNTGQEPSFILQYTPSVTAHSDAGSYMGYSYFRLRGIDQTRINMTLDGIPLNEPEDQGVYFSNYPDFFNSVNKIQIQRGVGTSTNGVASYAGSINFGSPALHKPEKIKFGADYGSFNTYRVYGEYNSGIKKHKGLYIRASQIHSDGYKHHSEHTARSVFLSTGVFKEKHIFKITGFAGNQKNDMAWIGVPMDTLKQQPRYNANSPNEDDEFTQALVLLRHSYAFNAYTSLTSSIFYNYLKGNYDFDLNNFLGLPSTEEMYNYAFLSDFGGAFTTFSYEKSPFSLHCGMHINAYQRQHTGSESSIGQLYQNTGYKNNYNSFVKMAYSLNQFKFYGDIQYRYTSFNYKGDAQFEKMNWNFINSRMGLNFSFTKNSNLYYSWGQTGREPTRNDLFNGEDNLPSGESNVPLCLEIKPESVSNHELGVKIKQPSWHLNGNLFYMSFKNEIVLNGQIGPTGLPLHSNVAQSYRSGAELDFGYQFDFGLSLINNSAYCYARITENNVKLQPVLTPELIINQEIRYQHKKWQTFILARYQSQSYIDFANQNILPDFFTINAGLHYDFGRFIAILKVINAFDETYYTNGHVDYEGTARYFIQAPRNYHLSIKWIF